MHDMVSIPKLVFAGGLVKTVAQGENALARGNLFIEQWRISVAESTLPRWVLRGVTITFGDKSMRISDDGLRILSPTRAGPVRLSDG